MHLKGIVFSQLAVELSEVISFHIVNYTEILEKGRAITFQGIARCDDLMTTMFNALAIRLLLLASTLRTRSYFVSMGGELPLSVV